MKYISSYRRIAALAVAVLFSLASLHAASPAWDSVKSVNAGWGSIDVRYPKDERPVDQMKAALAVLKEADPGFRIAGAAAVGYDGYLRWAWCSWPEDPMNDSRFGPWAAGDTYIVYPGAPSIRYERLVEGIQAFEKVRILRETLPAAELKDLEAVLKDCFSANFLDPAIPAALLVSKANAVLRTK